MRKSPVESAFFLFHDAPHQCLKYTLNEAVNRVSIEGVKNLCPMLKILVCQFRIYSPKKHTLKIYKLKTCKTV